MILATSPEEARPTRHEGVLYNGTRYWRSDYMGYPGSGHAAPQAFLVEQAPGSVVPPHFHETNQFQVVVKGNGKLGRHELGPYAVHYAGGHTAYGPINASPEGLYYFTLRAHSDPGAKFLPESKDKLKRIPRRDRVAEVRVVRPDGEPGAVGDSVRENVCDPVLEKEEDGLAAWLLRMGPGAEHVGPHPSAGGGQYYLVAGGSLLHGGAELPLWSCLFVSSEEPPLKVGSGAAGLEALILQYPRREAVEG